MRKMPADFPRSESSVRIKKAVKNLRKMTPAQKIQLLVNANLLSQADADQAIAKLERESAS
jgi:hypothetical protein